MQVGERVEKYNWLARGCLNITPSRNPGNFAEIFPRRQGLFEAFTELSRCRKLKIRVFFTLVFTVAYIRAGHWLTHSVVIKLPSKLNSLLDRSSILSLPSALSSRNASKVDNIGDSFFQSFQNFQYFRTIARYVSRRATTTSPPPDFPSPCALV